MASTHSIVNPSAAPRWSDCSVSVILTQAMNDGKFAETAAAKAYALTQIQKIFPGETAETFFPAAKEWVANRESKYAKEGTDAHEWAEKILKGKKKLEDLPERFAPVREYVELCKTLENRWEGAVFVESRVPLFYYKEERGTVDHGIISKAGRVFITDLKYGAGIPVEAERNLQLAIYALSFIEEYDMVHDFTAETPVEIRICQPRVEGGTKLWETTVGELRAMTSHLPTVVGAILKALRSGDHAGCLKFSPTHSNCRFCPNKQVCSDRGLNALAPVAAVADFEEVVEFGKRLVSPADILAIFARKKEIIAVLDDAEEYLLQMAMNGTPIPGTKLVKGRDGNRSWIDPEEAGKFLSQYYDDFIIYDTVMKSPTKIFKGLKDAGCSKGELESYEKYVTRAEGKPVLALEIDPRPALSSAESLFEEINLELEEV